MKEISGILEQFGLTEYEAKTLATLFKLSEAEAPDISRNAQVPKTRVYDVLEKLIEKRLVMEISGRPKKYRVVSPTETFSMMISAKKDELTKLEEEATQLQLELSSQFENQSEGGERVMKVKDKNDFLKILSHEIGKAQKEVVCFTKIGKKFPALSESLKLAAKNNATVKVLHEPDQEKHVLSDLTKNGIELKQGDHGLNVFVIDGKKVILFLSDPEVDRDEYHFTVWPQNHAMANMVKHYFDHHWGKE